MIRRIFNKQLSFQENLSRKATWTLSFSRINFVWFDIRPHLLLKPVQTLPVADSFASTYFIPFLCLCCRQRNWRKKKYCKLYRFIDSGQHREICMNISFWNNFEIRETDLGVEILNTYSLNPLHVLFIRVVNNYCRQTDVNEKGVGQLGTGYLQLEQ